MTDALVEAVARAVAEAVPETKWAWTESIVDGNLIVPIEGDVNMHHLATAALQAIEAAGYRVVPVEATDERLTAMAKAREGDQAYYILDMYRDLYGVAIGGGR